jgi:acyl carrier protein
VTTISREDLLKIATEALSDALAEKAKKLPADLSPETEIFGRGSLLDSLGLVTMVMELETRLEEEHGVTVVLASEKAMSRRSSPFRTLGALVDYIEAERKKGPA